MNVFVYNDVMKDKIQKILKITPISETLAETSGKLYMVARTPVMLGVHDITHCRHERRVFGTILTFDDKDAERILYVLDNYHSSTKQRLGILHPVSLTYQSTVIAYPIVFSNIQELENYRHKYKKGVKCITWIGNKKHPYLVYMIKEHRHSKLAHGMHMPSFKNILKRKGYLDD